MSWHVRVNGESASTVSVSDRGLLYGDGLFETILVDDGHAVLWREHMERLAAGCERLALPAPDIGLIETEVAQVASGRGRCVVRITLTRGEGDRGYRTGMQAPTRIVAAFPAPEADPRIQHLGVRMRWCETRLGAQPRLAGIKHLNRLEQVLARSEWDDVEIFEGLMSDSEGAVTCATAANLFVVRQGRLLTPLLDRAGVAGTCRAWIMRKAACTEVRLGREDVESAEEVLLTSSVRGIVPVTAIGSRRYHLGPTTRRLMAALHACEPALQPAPDSDA